jgi:hypothetical protein
MKILKFYYGSQHSKVPTKEASKDIAPQLISKTSEDLT